MADDEKVIDEMYGMVINNLKKSYYEKELPPMKNSKKEKLPERKYL